MNKDEEQELIQDIADRIRQTLLPKFTQIIITYDENIHKWNYSMKGYGHSVGGGDYDNFAETIEHIAKDFYGI